MINVVKAGMYTSIQDRGRLGYRSQGIPLSGTMDSLSASLANSLLGNDLHCALLEFTLLGPTLLFEANATVVITGATFEVFLDTELKPLHIPFTIKKGQTLRITKTRQGVRGYLAIKGGFTSQTVLGSKSQYNGITEKGSIDNNDVLTFDSELQYKISIPSFSTLDKSFFETSYIEVYQGPEFYLLPERIKQNIEKLTFKVSPKSNRMGIQILGLGELPVSEILTVPVQPGIIQWTPSGILIAVMKDGQTTGGYPRIFQTTEKSISVLSQKQSHQEIQFKIVKYTDLV